MSVNKGPFTQGITRSGEWFTIVSYRDYLKEHNRVKILGFATEEAAMKWEAAFHLRGRRDHLTMTMDEFFEREYLSYGRSKLDPRVDLSKTEKWFRIDRDKYTSKIHPMLGQTRICDLSTEVLAAIYHDMRFSSKTILDPSGTRFSYTQDVFAFLYSILEHTVRLEIKEKTAALAIPALSEDKLSLWRHHGISPLFSHLEGDAVLYAFFALMFWCGLHEYEVAALTRADVNFEKQTLEVKKAARFQPNGLRLVRGTGKKTRKVFVPEELLPLLDKLFPNTPSSGIQSTSPSISGMPFWFVTRHNLLATMHFIAGTQYLPVLSLPEFHCICEKPLFEEG